MQKITDKLTAEQHHREGRFDLAKEEYERYLSAYPNDADTLHALGVLLVQCQDYPNALKKIEAAIACNPNHAPYYNSLGTLYRRLSDWNNATKAYQKAIKLNSTYALAYNNLGNVFYLQKKYAAAQQAYEKAIALKENYADAHGNLGILFVQLENDSDARVHLEKALAINPTLYSAVNQLSDLYVRLGEYDLLLTLLPDAILTYPNSLELNHRFGIALFKKQAFEKARQQFEIVLQLDHTHPEVNQYLANTYLECMDHEKALYYYYCQMEKNPLFETYYNIAVLLMMKDKHNDALQYFNKALLLEKNDAATYLNLGHLHLKRNHIQEAIAAYQKANQLKPNDAEIQHILAALTQETTPGCAPSEYVSHLFDQYAAYYDKHLTDALKYDVPQQLFHALELEHPGLSESSWIIVDLGCGTGLSGAVFKPIAKKLIGVDLSENMISLARERDIYDALYVDDVTTSIPTFSGIHLILAADVFTYIGDLSSIFKAAQNALLSNGVFLFTVEKTFEHDFILQKTIRYAHSKSYLERLITEHLFEIMRFENIQLRKQRDTVIEGYLVMVRKR